MRGVIWKRCMSGCSAARGRVTFSAEDVSAKIISRVKQLARCGGSRRSFV